MLIEKIDRVCSKVKLFADAVNIAVQHATVSAVSKKAQELHTQRLTAERSSWQLKKLLKNFFQNDDSLSSLHQLFF